MVPELKDDKDGLVVEDIQLEVSIKKKVVGARKNYSSGKDAEQMEKALKYLPENPDASLNKAAKEF